MKHTLSVMVIMSALFAFAPPHAMAQESQPAKKSAKKPAKKAASANKKSNGKQAAAKEEEPDIKDSKSVDYDCELGNKLTVYENPADNQHIALRWNKRLSRMTRVNTTTGANRFENPSQGLVWIGIPAKGMLLDAKKGKQLANECKTAEQMNAQAVKTSAEPASASILTAPSANLGTEAQAAPAGSAAQPASDASGQSGGLKQ